MAKGPSKEQLGWLRWLSIGALAALFVADYGFSIFMKVVPNTVYYGLIAIALGIDIPQCRDIFLDFLKSWAGASNKDDKR